jgi:hypothetical protein
VKYFQIDGLSNWTMPMAFVLKLIAGLLLFWVHIQTYGIDELSHDGETFLKEGKYLNDVFFQSPKHYFQLLTGIDETTELINKYLYMTEYWSAGDLTLINDSKNVIRVHSIIHFFSRNSVIIHLSVFCFFSLIAVKNLYLALHKFSKQSNKIFFWIFLLAPSTIFWTSSLLKEPLLFFGLSLFVHALILETNLWKKIIKLFLAIFLLIGFKPYVLVCLLIALFSYIVYHYLFHFKLLPSILFLTGFTFLAGFMLYKPREAVVNYLTRKQFDFVNVGKGGLHVLADTCFYYFQPFQYENLEMKGNNVELIRPSDAFIMRFGSTQKPIPVHLIPKGEIWTKSYFTPGCKSFIETTPISNSAIQLIKNIPEALTNSVLRPFPTDQGSNLKYLSFLEVWLILFFLLFAIYNRRKLNQKEKGIIFILIIFALQLFLLIGWTTPVLGAITRYRFPAQLALILVGLIILKPLNFKTWKSMFS